MPDDENNGRVTVAILGVQIAHLTNTVQKIDSKLDAQGHDIAVIRNTLVQAEERHAALRREVDAINDEVKDARKQSKAADGLLGVAAVIGSVISSIIGTQR